MADVGVGFVDILPRSDTFVKTLTAQMQSAFKGVSTQMTSLAKGFTGVQTAAVGAGLIAAAGILKGVHATQEWAAEVRSLQRVTGLAAEDASKLAAAGTELGIPVAKLNIAFGLLSKNIVNGSTNFDKYNIATKDATGNTLPMLDVLANVSDKFATLAPGAEQTAFAMNVFGKSGKDMIPILARGSDGLQELYDKAQAAGLVMGQDTLDAAKNLTLAQRELGEAVKGASIAIGESFIPVVQKVTEVLTSMVELIQLVPKPVLAAAEGFAVLAGALVVAQKAWTMMRAAASASMKALTGWGPLVAVIAASAIVLKNVLSSTTINLDEMSKQTKISADLLGFFRDRMDLFGHAFEAHSFGGFIAGLGDTQAHLDALTQAMAPAIEQVNKLGLSQETQTTIFAKFAEELDGSAESQAKYVNDTQGVIDIITEETKLFAKGGLTLKELIGILGVYGVTAADATSLANDALDKTGRHLNDLGKKVTNFAGMTTPALKAWAGDITSTMQDTFGNVGSTIKDTFDMTPKEAQKAFDDMLKSAIRWKADISAVLALKPGTLGLNPEDTQRFEVWLTKQAPDVVDAFVHGTIEQQHAMAQDWAHTVGQMNATTNTIKDVTITANTKQAEDAIRRVYGGLQALPTQKIVDIIVKREGAATGGWVTGAGIIPHFAAGGSTDTIPAMLSPGEFVLQKSAVDRIGLADLMRMNQGGGVSERAVTIQKPQKIDGSMRITDWRNGLATLDAELGWEDTVRTR